MKNLPDLKGVKVCLIFPPYRESRDIAFLATTKKNLGKITPLSLCSVAAALESHGVLVKIIDANARDLSFAQTIKETEEFSPDFLGFTLSTYQFHFTLEWIKRIRAQVMVPVIVGGPHARLYPAEILTHPDIDCCVVGDAEDSLPQLINCLLNKTSLEEVGGVAYRTDGDKGPRIKINNFNLYISNLDDVPLPSRHLLDNTLYYSLISKYKNFTAMTTTRGCVFQCIFCDNHCMPHRQMAAVRVVNEMEACQKDFGINEIDMFDGVFSISRGRILEICEEITRRKLKIHWSIRTRADLVDKDTLSALKKAGCIRIYYGIESGSPEILKNIKKGMDLEQIKETVKFTKKIGIDTFGYFMIGSPGETKETLRHTSRLMQSLPLDYVQIAPIFYPPNTEIYARLTQSLGEDYWKEYTLRPNYFRELPVLETQFSKKEINNIAKRMYLRFYLRPTYIFKAISRLKISKGLMRGSRAVFDMLNQS
jgi:anaerobic magnesium-protoporphyrin IX monomethyl ester cyclase